MAESNVESLTQIPLDLAEKESIRVLHVDDEPGLLKAAKQCLEMQGPFQVEIAFSVEEALEKMDGEDFDAIVCDYVMPGKDGLEFLKELRAKGNRIPFIIFTGKGREEVAIKALNLGADQYLNKTGDPEAVYGELAHGIRRAVERKRAYMELWRREERLRAILTSSPDAIIIGDLHGNVVDCNEAALRLVGFSSKEELVGKSSFEFIAKKDRERAMGNLKKTLEEGVTENIEYTLLTVNGEEYVGELSVSVIKDSFGNPTGFVGILRDITERKKAEERLRESEEKYRSLFENAVNVTLTYDLKGNVTSVNKATVEYGFKKDEIIGKNMLKFVPKKYWPRLLKELIQNTRGKTLEGEIEINTPKGKKVAEYRSNPIVIANKVVGVQTTLRDITGRKKVEKERKKLLHDYGERIKELRCLYRISKLVEKTGISLGEVLQKSTNLLPSAWQHPDIACARIVFEGQEFKTKTFKETRWKQQADIKVHGKKAGLVEVCYLEEKPTSDEGPFLKEERDLIEVVADRLGRFAESRQAEEALRESEEKFRSIFENASDCMIYLDRAGRILDVNRKAVEVFGGTKEELLRRHFTKVGVVSPRDIPRLVTAVAKGLAGKRATLDIRIKNRKGQEIDLECSNSLLKIDGKFIGLLVVARDITERKKAEEELKSSKERLNVLFQDAPDAYYLNDLKGNFIDGNKAAEELTGYKKKELIGKNFLKLKLLSRKQIPKAAKLLTKNALGKSTGPDEFTLNRKDGTQVPVEIRTFPVKIEDQTLVLGIARDITKRKRMEEALRESEKQARRLLEFQDKLIDTAVVWINLLDEEGNITMWNRAAELVSGYSRERVIGHKKVWEWLYPDPKYRAEIFAEAKEILEKGKLAENFQTTIRCKDGTLKTISWYSNNILDEKGKLVGSIAIGIDITKTIEAQERVRESEEKYRSLFENAGDVITTFDLKGNVTSINKAVEEYGFKKDEIIGKNMRKFVSKKYWPRLLKDLTKIARGEAVKGEIELITPKGKVMTEHRSNPTRRGKKVVGIQSVLRGITERKRFEEKLSALNTYSRSLNTADNMEKIYELTLDAAEETLGFEFADVLTIEGRMLRLVTHRGYYKDLSIRLSLDGDKGITVRAARTGKPVLVPDVRKDKAFVEGMPGMRSELAVPIKIGNKVLGVLNVESKRLDAFDEKDKELLEILASHAATAISNLEYAKSLEAYAREIRESREEFKSLFVDNPEAAVYLGPDFHILDVNPRFEELFGHPLDEIKGKHINDVVVPEDRMEEAEMFDKRASKGEAYQEDTVRRRKDGTLIPVSFSAAPITVENRVIGHLVIYKDISQLKITEKKLRETLEKLERMNEKLRVVGKFTRHDARNKLSMATTNVFLAKQKLTSDNEALEHLSEIELACRQVEGIFDFARIYEQLGAEELAYTDVEKSLEEAAMLFSDLPGVKIVNKCHGLTVLADSLLRQLFYNLIDNSLKHGEKVSQIRVYYEEMGKDKLKLVYEDDGVGIPKAEKEKIFQEGYGKGTGYGLYLIRKICEVYGWTIREKGKPGKGAKFIITIPKTSERRR